MQQADAIDVKSSVMVVAVTFLAGQSTFLLSRQIGSILKWEQVSSIAIQIAAGVLLGIILGVYTYHGERTEKYPGWRNELTNFHQGKDEEVTKDMLTGIIGGMADRCKEAFTTNDRKAGLLVWAYKLTAFAFFLNLCVLICQLCKWL